MMINKRRVCGVRQVRIGDETKQKPLVFCVDNAFYIPEVIWSSLLFCAFLFRTTLVFDFAASTLFIS